jgi:O-antigen/teichoic acid export membrane protein
MSVTKNYFYNLVYQILLIILPIITVPYITRVFGTNGVGINTYTNSIIQYFVLLGTLGIGYYGSRTIAYVRDDREELSRVFWSIFIIKLVSTLIAYATFIVFIYIDKSSYRIYLWIQSINIISVAADVSWFLMGLEQFKKTVTRNLIVKIISVILIFTFVKTAKDLWLYILINGLSTLVGQLVLWVYIPKIIVKVKIGYNDIKSHILPSIKLFIPQIATQIYCIFDKTFVGYMVSTNEVGIYDMGQKIVYMVLTITSSMGTVLMPRITNVIAKGDLKKVKEYVIKSFNFASYLSIPICLGLIGISKGFSIWFFGNGFLRSSYIMRIESIAIILISWNNVTGIQMLLPLGKTNEYSLTVTIGAVVDIISNLILVKFLFSMGAAISTDLAELSILLIQIYLLRKDLPFKGMLKDIWKYLLSGLIMLICVELTGSRMNVGFITTLIQVFVGGLVYVILLYVLKSDFQNGIIDMVKKKLKLSL